MNIKYFYGRKRRGRGEEEERKRKRRGRGRRTDVLNLKIEQMC